MNILMGCWEPFGVHGKQGAQENSYKNCFQEANTEFDKQNRRGRPLNTRTAIVGGIQQKLLTRHCSKRGRQGG